MRDSEYAPPSGSVILVRYGELPPEARSKNHLTGELEPGVSVYEAIVRDGGVQIILPSAETPGLVSLSGVSERPLYEVAGVLAGTGSDGEPLLSPCRIVRQVGADSESPAKHCHVCGRLTAKDRWRHTPGERPLCPEHEGEG